MAGGARALGEAVVYFRANIGDWNKGLAGMAGGLESLSAKLKSTGAAIQDIGSQFLKVGASGASALGFAVKSAADFEAALIRLERTTGLTGAALANMGQTFTDMSESLPGTAEELTRIAAMGAQMGVSQDALVAFTKSIAILGQTTDLVGEAGAMMLAQFANVTHVPDDEFENLGSAIYRLGLAGASTEAQMMDMALRLGGAGTVAGIAVPDILALANAMTSAGINAEAGGTAMSMTIQKIAKAVEQGGKDLDAFAEVAGISAARFAETWRSRPVEAIGLFLKGMKAASDSGEGFFALLESMDLDAARMSDVIARSSQAYDLLADSIAVSNTAYKENTGLTEAATIAGKGFWEQLKNTKDMLTNLATTAGNVLLPALRGYMESVRGFVEELKTFAKDHPQEFQARIEQLAHTIKIIFATGAILFAVGWVLKFVATLGAATATLITFGTKIIWLVGAIAGLSTGTLVLVAGIAALAAAIISATISVVQLVKGFAEWRAAVQELEDSNARLGETTNNYLAHLEKQGVLTKEQIENLKSIKNEQDRYTETLKAANAAQIEANIIENQAYAQELENLLGRKATREEVLRAVLAGYQLDNDAKLAALAVTQDVSAKEVAALQHATDKEKERFIAKLNYGAQVTAQQQMTTDAIVSAMQRELVANGMQQASQQELLGLREFAAQNEITMMDALLARRYKFTDEQIAQIGRLSMAEIQAMQQSSLTRKQDTEQLAADLAAKGMKLQEFSDYNTQRINELAAQKQRIITELQALNTIAADEDRKLTEEELARRTQLTEQYLQNNEMMGSSKQVYRDIALAVEEQVQTKAAEALGVEDELTKARLEGGEAQKFALEELRAKHEEYINAVISSSAATKTAFETASSNTQTEMQNVVALWAESGTRVEDAAKRWQTAYRALPPSAGENAYDKALNDYGSISKAIATLTGEAEMRMEEIAKANEKLPPSSPGPSGKAPLGTLVGDYASIQAAMQDLAVNNRDGLLQMQNTWADYADYVDQVTRDIADMYRRTDPTARHSPSLVDNVASGTAQMIGLWRSTDNSLHGIMLNIYEALQYINPYAKHSPSLVEQVIRGWDEMTEVQRRNLLRTWEIMKKLYGDQLELLADFFAQGLPLSAGLIRDIQGQITGADIVVGPEGLDVDALLEILRNFEKILGTESDPLALLFDLLSKDKAEERSKLLAMLQAANSATTANAPVDTSLAETIRTTSGNGGIRTRVIDGNPEVEAKILENLLQSGLFPPDQLPPNDVIRKPWPPSETPAPQIIINIETIRTDEDIKKLAAEVSFELDKAAWRYRR